MQAASPKLRRGKVINNSRIFSFLHTEKERVLIAAVTTNDILHHAHNTQHRSPKRLTTAGITPWRLTLCACFSSGDTRQQCNAQCTNRSSMLLLCKSYMKCMFQVIRLKSSCWRRSQPPPRCPTRQARAFFERSEPH